MVVVSSDDVRRAQNLGDIRSRHTHTDLALDRADRQPIGVIGRPDVGGVLLGSTTSPDQACDDQRVQYLQDLHRVVPLPVCRGSRAASAIMRLFPGRFPGVAVPRPVSG